MEEIIKDIQAAKEALERGEISAANHTSKRALRRAALLSDATGTLLEEFVREFALSFFDYARPVWQIEKTIDKARELVAKSEA